MGPKLGGGGVSIASANSPSIIFLTPPLIENGMKIVLRGLIGGLQCLAPVHGYRSPYHQIGQKKVKALYFLAN